MEGLPSKCLQEFINTLGGKCVKSHLIPYTKINYILSKMICVKERNKRKKDKEKGEEKKEEEGEEENKGKERRGKGKRKAETKEKVKSRNEFYLSCL